MKRVVITGFGIISSIGNDKNTVLSSLKKSKSGIVFSKKMKDFGMKSHVWGKINLEIKNIRRNFFRFMNYASIYAYFAMKQAIHDSLLNKQKYQNNYRIGVISGIGCNFFRENLYSINTKKTPYFLMKNMHSNISACLSTFYKIRGISYSISAACSTALNCINDAVRLIKHGYQDIIFAGGAEEVSCELAAHFDRINALSKRYNAFPSQASRPYDIYRDGFVISGGAGIIVLEELEHALSRKARIYAEIIGYGSASDGINMIRPSGCGLTQSMKLAIQSSQNVHIDYINTHGTSTQAGDLVELKAIKEIFKNTIPYISSTKSITGHALGASGVQEIIYIILMMYNNFIAPTINIDVIEPFAKKMNIISKVKLYNIFVAMCNSCGFGGVNASIILKKYN
ncbi:beta-ketoacyl synthase N-terminal-like domain-containing protein [Buchnera aphidicola]|uniref:3-oxoacyl-[acyl-carrier-protein] synthase 1 n=1 Tax=Buchnera aphidicola (Sarucallis kahawaluokalani) TaxID=1241878 RepID=A0A4D6YJH6_9GAMM|nr:beta-ketoacyl synthase N-terminal-like domain-containing protein [Buchnera aphidicola]QCI25868.1 beta-ketoacyl-[acyl-carrier-protein] synthase I [Buchnera aphidicola (Sarucallis kahawaluokalani)]